MFDGRSPVEDRQTLFVQRYHPDVLRRPEPPFNAPAGDRVRLAMTWNVFRTFEQVAPPFWIRRLVARLSGVPEQGTGAPHTVRVSCWTSLPLAPRAMLRRGRRGPVAVDVLIETEESLIALVVPAMADLASPVLSDTADGGLLELVEAASWRAGVRATYAGVVLPWTLDASVWATRVHRRGRTVLRILRANGADTSHIAGVGALTWASILEVLDEVAGADVIEPRERTLAAETSRWLARALRGPSARGVGLLPALQEGAAR